MLLFKTILWYTYLICIIPSLLLTWSREHSGITLNINSSYYVRVFLHFISVWLIMPIFLIYLIYEYIIKRLL